MTAANTPPAVLGIGTCRPGARPRRAAAGFVAALLLALAAVLFAAPAQAGLLANLLSPGDSGSGKVAQLAFHLDDATFAPTSVVWSPDGRYIATSGVQTRSIHIWDVAQRKLVKQLELPNIPAPLFHNMAWSPDGRYLATCNNYASALRIYSTKDWSVAKDFGRDIAGGCQKLAFSSDSQQLTAWSGYAIPRIITFATSDWHVIRRVKGEPIAGAPVAQAMKAWNLGLLLHDMAYIPGTHALVFGGGHYEKNTDACGPVAYPHTPYAGRVWILRSGATALSIADSFVAYCPQKVEM